MIMRVLQNLGSYMTGLRGAPATMERKLHDIRLNE